MSGSSPGVAFSPWRRVRFSGIAPDARHDTATRELYALVVAPQRPSAASGSSSGDPTLRESDSARSGAGKTDGTSMSSWSHWSSNVRSASARHTWTRRWRVRNCTSGNCPG